MRTADDTVRGVVFIHSCPRALISHVDWAVQRAVASSNPYEWESQPVVAGMFRCEIDWTGPRGAGAAIASALRGFPRLRFEVTEDRPDGNGERFCFTPALGMFRGMTGPNGDLTVTEQRLRALLEADDQELRHGLEGLLGQPWDAELESFRVAGDPGVRWLTA